MIELTNVSKSFNEKRAVSDLSLVVNSGEFFGWGPTVQVRPLPLR